MQISQPEKIALFDQIIQSRYEAVVRIDVHSGIAETLHSTNRDLSRTIGKPFPFEETMKRYIMKRSVDADPGKIISSLSPERILEELRQSPVYFTHFIICEADDPDREPILRMKRIAFHSCGTADQLIMTSEDITAVFGEISSQGKNLEQALLNVREDMNERTEFLRRLDDKVRQPLYSLLGIIRIKEESKSDEAAMDAYLQKISMSGTFMKDTIDDLIDLRRISRNELVMYPQTVLVADLITEVRNAIRPAAAEKGLIFSLDSGDVPSLRLKTDPDILRRTIIRLLKSAMAYAVQGGRITLRFRKLFVQNGSVTLRAVVVSRGLVFDRARLESLFRPHSYVTEKDNLDIGSVDLDLIVLRQYLRMIGVDSMIIESDEQSGVLMEITLTLPLA